MYNPNFRFKNINHCVWTRTIMKKDPVNLTFSDIVFLMSYSFQNPLGWSGRCKEGHIADETCSEALVIQARGALFQAWGALQALS